MENKGSRIVSSVLFFVLFNVYISSALGQMNSGKIGVVLPLTGDGAMPGISFRNGMDLALKKLPNDVKENIVFIVEDDQMLPRNTVSIYKRLRSVNGIVAVETLHRQPQAH